MKGIEITNDAIYINGKREKIMSGAVHYFRVVPEYWYDRLLKLKELGCNCVETYVCWNLHEKREGNLISAVGLISENFSTLPTLSGFMRS